MSRRRAATLAVALVIAVGSASSATPAGAVDDVAAVNGEGISVAGVGDVIDALVASDIGWEVNPGNGTIPADRARLVVETQLLNTARRQFIAENEIELPADLDEAAADDMLAQQGLDSLAGAARDMVVEQIVTSQQIGTAELDVNLEDRAEQYQDNPVSLGVVCVNLLLFADEGDADRAADALRAGDAASDVAETFGAEPGSTDVQCISTTELGAAAPGVLASVVDLSAGDVLDPQVGATGWQVIGMPEFADVVEPLGAYLDAPSPSAQGGIVTTGQILFDGWLLAADIDVDARYGRWDPVTSTIVPLGQE